MVANRHEAQTISYRLADPDSRALIAALYEIFCVQGPEPDQTDVAGQDA